MISLRRTFLVLAFLAFLAMSAIAVGLSVGSVEIPFADVMAGLFDSSAPGASVIRDLRLPRTLAAFACGGLLAMAGALMQVLLRNPLADPYILGISGGAGVGALLAIFFGLGVAGLNGFAFLGALLAILVVFGLAHGDGSWTQTRLLLTGVMVAAGCGALITLLLSIAPEERLRGMLFWLMGDFSQGVNPTFALVGLGAVGLLTAPLARDLNVLIRGNDAAKALGVSVRFVRVAVYLLASMATAISVTTAGSVGFVGLVIPHLTRMMVGNDQRVLLPTAMLAGGIFLVLADALARILIAPQQLPVGVVTALIGVPVFLYLLNRTRYQ
ncbi:MAG: iron ABC transporter permease [Rhodocyclaceae bacterium]|jgi:iron complex transport system permease protein|nr:iron ABC transporter permease [Rhodocyclaceae bacterium]